MVKFKTVTKTVETQVDVVELTLTREQAIGLNTLMSGAIGIGTLCQLGLKDLSDEMDRCGLDGKHGFFAASARAK